VKGTWASHNVPDSIQTAIDALSGPEAVYWIEHDAQNPASYIINLREESVLEHNYLPPLMTDEIVKHAFVGFRDISYGYDGSFLMITNGDIPCTDRRIHLELKALMKNSKVKPVLMVVLSPYTRSDYFVVFVDGTSTYDLPIAWHEKVDAIRKGTARRHEKRDKLVKKVAGEASSSIAEQVVSSLLSGLH